MGEQDAASCHAPPPPQGRESLYGRPPILYAPFMGIDLGFGPVGAQTWSPNKARFIVTLTKTL